MATDPTSMNEVYRGFLEGTLPLEDAARMLRHHAAEWRTEADSLRLDTLPDAEREKAAALFNEAIYPIFQAFLAEEISVDSAAHQLAPLVLPLGVFALNFNMPAGPAAAAAAMSRFMKLMKRLTEVADP